MKKRLSILVLIAVCSMSGSSALASLVTGLEAYYPFSGDARDKSGNGHHGTVVGAQLIPDRFGNSDSAYYFSGAHNYITVADMTLTNTSFTIAAWVSVTEYPDGERGFIRRGNHANYILAVNGQNANLTFSSHPPPDYAGNRVIGSSEIELNQWAFLAGVYDRDTGVTKIYLNGLLDGSNSNAQDPHDPGGNLEIGNWFGTRVSSWNYPAFVGGIDDVRIYNRALESEEILALHAIPVPSAIWLFGPGLGLLSFLAHRKTKAYATMKT